MTSAERLEKIRQARLKQPLFILERKADIARNRNNTWTQEELDLAKVKAAKLFKFFKWSDRAGGDASHSSEK